VQAVILVGGEGTRLRPLTSSEPKQMLPIMGIPMLEGVLRHLGLHGVDEAILSLGYLPDKFLEAYPTNECAGVRLRYAIEPEPLDTAGAIRFAAEELHVGETFVVVNGDVLTDLDLTSLLAFHRETGAEGTLALHPVDDPSRYGVVPTDERGRVKEFVEKPDRQHAPTNEINAGTYVLEPSVLDRIPLGEKVSIERVIFPQMVRDGVLYARCDESYWLDTGTPASFLQAHHDFLSGERVGKFAPGVLANGSFIHVNAVVAADARVSSSMIDAGVHLASGSVVTNSVIFPDVTIAGGVTVTNSIVGTGSILESGVQLESTCVIGFGEVIPAHSVLSDARVPS